MMAKTTDIQEPIELLRPGDFARLLLAGGSFVPRKRARDQQADIAGLELKRNMLAMLASLDPEPSEIEAALAQIVHWMDVPTGPLRAVAAAVREDWQTACGDPRFLEHLLSEAVCDDKQRHKQSKSYRPAL